MGFFFLASVLLLVLLGFVVVAVVAALMRRRAAPQPALAGAPGALRSYSPDKVGNDASARPWERDLTPAGGSMIGSALGMRTMLCNTLTFTCRVFPFFAVRIEQNSLDGSVYH